MTEKTEQTIKNDLLYGQAVEIVVGAQIASISFLQRNLLIGYNHAARLIEAMESHGIIGPLQSDGIRKVHVRFVQQGESTMSIMHCNKHGTWNLNVSASCPRCWEENRKTFLGMTAVSWFLFSYIVIVLIAMAWIVISHVPEAQ